MENKLKLLALCFFFAGTAVPIVFADYAEWFEKDTSLWAGDVVGLNPDTGKARKYISGDVLIGIVSTSPGIIGDNTADRNKAELRQDKVLVGLLGKLMFDKSQVVIEGRKVSTFDNKQIGYLLNDGRVFLKIRD